MTARSVTLPAEKSAADPLARQQPCPCGCAPCDGTCCSLECLVQPRFFCGQLLTDQDLTALLRWGQSKFRLSRYRDGWGVVSGLDVRCDPQQPGHVIIGPGYAISCCGDDIIVCEDASFDLSDVCRSEKDPCEEGRTGKAEGGADQPDVRLIDLSLHYREEPSEPQTALGRNVCRQVAECEYGRTREVFRLSWQEGASNSDPMQVAADRWQQAYDDCLTVVSKFQQKFTAPYDEAARRWLLRWFEEHPLHQFCELRDQICDEDFLTNTSNVVRALFWLVQDCRNAFLNSDCHLCPDDQGVPLARVWLQVVDQQGKRTCEIQSIDNYPPYRRPIGPACWPAPLGQINLGWAIWHRQDEVCALLAGHGIRVSDPTKFELPATVADLEKVLQDGDLFASCGSEPTFQAFDAGPRGQRVVGFGGGTKPAPPPPDSTGLAVKIGAAQTVVYDNFEVQYIYRVTNTGKDPLTVEVHDDLTRFSSSFFILDAGATQTHSSPYYAQTAQLEIKNTVTASGARTGGQMIEVTDTNTIKVLQGPQPLGLAVYIFPSVAAAKPGDWLEYDLWVWNFGDTSLDVTVVHNPLGVIYREKMDPRKDHRELIKFQVPTGIAGDLTTTVTATGRAPDGQTATDTHTDRLKIAKG